MKTAHITLASAIGIGGVLYRAGSTIEVSEDAAKDLLRRGKGELATEPEAEAEAEAADEAGEPADEPAATPKRGAKK